MVTLLDHDARLKDNDNTPLQLLVNGGHYVVVSALLNIKGDFLLHWLFNVA